MEPTFEGAWRHYLASRPEALFYASLECRDLVKRILGATPHYLMATEGDTVRGVLPCFASADRGAGVALNSLPYYGSNGGVLSDGDPEVERLLLDAYFDLEAGTGCVASTLISSPFDGTRDLYERGMQHAFRDERIGQLTPLPGPGVTEERLFGLYDETARRNVRKARKSGVTFRRANDSIALDFLYQTHQANIRAIGGLPKDRIFFESISAAVPENMRAIYVAEKDGAPIAALLLFFFNQTVEYYTPAVVEAFRPLQALALLVHEAMMDASRAGYRWWNWGGTWKSQEGVYRFKKKWGAEEKPYFYYTRVRNKRVLNASRQDLLAHFPGFFVVPFGALRQPVKEGLS